MSRCRLVCGGRWVSGATSRWLSGWQRGRGPHSPSPAPAAAARPGLDDEAPCPCRRGQWLCSTPASPRGLAAASAPRRSPGSRVSAGTSRPRRFSGPPADLNQQRAHVTELCPPNPSNLEAAGVLWPARCCLHTGCAGSRLAEAPGSRAAQLLRTRWPSLLGPPHCVSASLMLGSPQHLGTPSLGFCHLPTPPTAPLVWD